MKTIVILKLDLVLNKLILDCVTCNDNQVSYHLQKEHESLLKEVNEGYIDPLYRIEVVDKLRTSQFVI